MRWNKSKTAIVVGAIAVSAGQVLATDYYDGHATQWDGPVGVEANWNVATNWKTVNGTSFIPDGLFGEFGYVGNGGIVSVDSVIASRPGDFSIGTFIDNIEPNTGGAGFYIFNGQDAVGTVKVSSGGVLHVQGAPLDNGGSAHAFGGAGELRVGFGAGGADTSQGLGLLAISGNGQVTADRLIVRGRSDGATSFTGSTLRLSDNASLTITGDRYDDSPPAVYTSASSQRNLHIVGPNVNFNITKGDLQIDGNVTIDLQGASHNPVTVTAGNINLGQVNLNLSLDHAPSVGESWTLFSGQQVFGEFNNVDLSAMPSLQRGRVYAVENDGKSISVDVANRMILTVDRVTGQMSIENPLSTDTMNFLRVSSSSGSLDANGWTGLSAQDANWVKGNASNSNSIVEANLLASATVNNTMIDLGNGFVGNQNFAMGTSNEDVKAFYLDETTGDKINIEVEYVGGFNQLTVVVDPSTGQASLVNDTAQDLNLLGYEIQSESMSMDATAWQASSLSDHLGAGWEEATNSADNKVSEFNTGGGILAAGQSVALGQLFDITGVQDLSLKFILEGEEDIADLDGDGDIDADDLAAVMAGFDDEIITLESLFAVRNNFGKNLQPSGINMIDGVVIYETAQVGLVPEPASISMMLLGSVMLLKRKK